MTAYWGKKRLASQLNQLESRFAERELLTGRGTNCDRFHCEDLPDGQRNLAFWESSKPLDIARFPNSCARLTLGRLTHAGNDHAFDELTLVFIIDSALSRNVLERKWLRVVQIFDENSSHP